MGDVEQVDAVAATSLRRRAQDNVRAASFWLRLRRASSLASGALFRQSNHRPLTSPSICNSLHHKVTGLRLAASATAHGLALELHHLAVPVLHDHPCIWPIMRKYDVIHKTGSIYITYRNTARGGPSQTDRHGHHNTSPPHRV